MTKDEQLLARALAIATRAHRGQVDKAGAPYLGHPVRVSAALDELDAKVVGLLHDVVEDSEITLDDLAREGFSVNIVAAVDAISRRPDEPREDYEARVFANRLATLVKIADVTDNLDPSRISDPTPRDEARRRRYEALLPRLRAALTHFSNEIRQE